MVETVRQLHREFAELVVGEAMTYWWFSGTWALEKLQISPAAKTAPAFFLANKTTVPEMEATPYHCIDALRLPFPSFWLAYRWDSDEVAASEFAYFEKQGNSLKLATYKRGDGKDAWSGKVYQFTHTTHLVAELNTIEKKCLGKVFEVLDTINQPVELADVPPSLLIRRKLARGGVTSRASRFISVTSKRAQFKGASISGSLKSPHDRRGHWRTYRSGKSIWIKDCHIHGGANVGRSYSVLKH